MATRNFVPRADNEGGIGTALKRWAAGCIVKITANNVIISDGAGNYMQLPKLTTAERDALSAVNGMVIYNTTTLSIQSYENGAWGAMAGGENNTASNVGTAGIGIFKQKTGVDLEFKNINAGSSKITIADDVPNNEVDIDVDPTKILTANSVTATIIAASAVTTAKINTGAVTNAKIAPNTVTTTKIAASAVTTVKINTSAVTTAKIAASAITTTLINATAVTAAKIGTSAVTTTKIAASAVTTAKIDATAVTAAKIAPNAITTTKIAASAITTAKINTSAVTTAKIAASAITTTLVNAGAITTQKIANGTDGELITWDSNGNPAVVAVGTAGHVLTSSGVGKAPTFKAAADGTMYTYIPVEATYYPATNPASPGEVAGVGIYAGHSMAAFDDATAESMVFRIWMPGYDGGDIVLKAGAVPATTPVSAVTLQFDILTIGVANSEEFKSADTVDTNVNLSFSMDTTELNSDLCVATATINPANVAADDWMVIEFKRDVANDDLSGDGQFLWLGYSYTKA